MATASRKRRLFFVKILGLLSIVRWPNVLFTGLAQYITAIYVFTPEQGHWSVLSDPELHYIAFATAFIVAAGFIINSFYDLEKDLINRPNRTLFNRVVSKEFCLRTYFMFNFIGLSFAALASWRVLLFFSAFTFGLWFYSHKLQKLPVIREVSASVLSVISVFSIALYYQHFNWTMALYGVIFGCFLFNREIIKNLKNLKGDIAVGNQSISTVWGVRTSKNILGFVSILIVSGLLAFFHYSNGHHKLIFTIFISMLVLLSWGIVTTSKRKKALFWAHRLYKIIMAVAVFYLIVY